MNATPSAQADQSNSTANPSPGPAKPVSHGKELYRWRFPEFVQHRRSRRWFTWAGLIAVAAFIWAIFDGNVLFAVIIILAAIIYVTVAQRTPRRLTVTIAEDGIVIDRDFFSWNDLEAFWIVYQPPEVKKLFFRFKAALRPPIGISLERENPVSIRKTLLKYVSEDINGQEPGSDQVSRVLKL